MIFSWEVYAIAGFCFVVGLMIGTLSAKTSESMELKREMRNLFVSCTGKLKRDESFSLHVQFGKYGDGDDFDKDGEEETDPVNFRYN